MIGFMGTGKTEIGRRLAKALDWPFVDTDDRIREREGMGISAIFEAWGETGFRSAERGAVAQAVRLESAVIATGGGAILDPENRRLLRPHSVWIGLEAPPETILTRTSGTGRPLLEKGDRKKIIRDMMAERARFYAMADHRIDTSRRNPEQAANMIRDILKSADPIGVDLGYRGYSIEVGTGNLDRIGERMGELGIRGKVAVVTNPRVDRLYGAIVRRSLRKAGYRPLIIRVPDGERYKTLKTVSRIYDFLVRNRFERNSTLLALGGGVIGDLAGFAAATFLRGIAVVQVPTTLAAQVDASIGGKTGVDHPKGKNLIGAFHQPREVFIDTRVLDTLTLREFISGLGEVIKYGMIADEAFFAYLEDNIEKILKREPAVMEYIVRRSCAIKAEVVGKDEREGELRKILNYGHTFAHALETATGYRKFLHGEAVAMGMVFAAHLGLGLGMGDPPMLGRLVDLIRRAGLPVSLPKIKTADILSGMALDKKVSGGRIHFVLARKIGSVTVEPVELGEIRRLLKKGF